MPLPQSVRYLIEDVGRRHGRLVAGRGGLFVRSDDPSIVAAVVADRRLARLEPRALAPTVALFGEHDLDKLLKALRAAGYMPVAEPEARGQRERDDEDDEDLGVEIGWGRGRRAGGRPILYRHAARSDRPRLRPAEIARIAAAVAEDAARPPAAGPAPVADSLCRLIEHTPDLDRIPYPLIDQHVDAVRAIIREHTRPDAAATAEALTKKLREVTDEFLLHVNRERPDYVNTILAPPTAAS